MSRSSHLGPKTIVLPAHLANAAQAALQEVLAAAGVTSGWAMLLIPRRRLEGKSLTIQLHWTSTSPTSPCYTNQIGEVEAWDGTKGQTTAGWDPKPGG